MDRFSVHVDAGDDPHGRTYEFPACDASAMLDWLQHDVGVSCATLSRAGQHTVRLIPIGRDCGLYWMILPAGDRS